MNSQSLTQNIEKNLQVLSNKKKLVNKYILFCFILQFSSPNSLSFLSDVEHISVLIVPNFSARWQSIQTILTETSGLARNKFFFIDDSVEMYDNDQEVYSI